MSNRNVPTALIDAMEVFLLRIRCGQTPAKASVELPQPKTPTALREAWKRLTQQINNGRVPPDAGVAAFLAHLKLQDRFAVLLRQKLFIPKIQSFVVLGLGLVFTLASMELFPSGLRPSPLWIAAALGLCLLGFAWTRHELGALKRRLLWYGDWLLLLSKIRSMLSWGLTLPPSLSEAGTPEVLHELPSALREHLVRTLDRARQGLELPACFPETYGTRQPELRRAFEQLQNIQRQYEHGDPVGPLLDAMLPPAFESFERRMTLEAEKLGFRLLVPLFACQLPAFLLLLFGPLLQGLASA